MYVANGNDTLSVIDTRTKTVRARRSRSIRLPTRVRTIAVSGDKVYVTDYVDDWVRVLNLARVQTAPQANGPPTVGTPDSDHRQDHR